MSLQRKTRSVKKVVAILTDPHPEFASLVQYPANQTPFKVVKNSPAELDARSQDMALKAASAVVDIHQIVFSKSHPSFKTVEAVAEYLDNNGFENFQINDEDKFFVVPGRVEEDFEGDLENVKVQKGMVMTMGRLRPARKAAAPETVIKAAEAARTEAALETSTKSIYHVGRFAEVLESLGYLASSLSYEAEYEEDNSTIPAKLREWISSGAAIFKDLADEEVAEFITYVQAQKADRAERTAKSQESTTVADTAAPKTTPVAAPGKAPTSVQPNADPKTVATPAVATPAAEVPAQPAAIPEGQVAPAATGAAGTAPVAEAASTAPVTTTSGEPAVTDTTGGETATETNTDVVVVDPAAAETAAKAAGVDPNTAALIAGIGKAFADALNPVAKSLTELTDRVTKSETRVEAIEAGTRQSRKSGDIETTSAPITQTAVETPEAERTRKFAERQARNRMGL